jgi:hypothetical protein
MRSTESVLIMYFCIVSGVCAKRSVAYSLNQHEVIYRLLRRGIMQESTIYRSIQAAEWER